MTDAGQVFNALASDTTANAFDVDLEPKPIDAIVHFAAIPRILLTTDNEVFRINVMATYNVLDAASKLGIKKVIIASSETTYGVVFAHRHRDPEYFPLDEQYPVDPMDSYAMSKVINEVTAKAFHSRTGADIYCFRVDYEKFPAYFKDPGLHKRMPTRNRKGRTRLGSDECGRRRRVIRPAHRRTAAAFLPECAAQETVGRVLDDVEQ